VTSAFFAYRDAPERRRALASPVGSPERSRLCGLDELRARGVGVEHNLEAHRPAGWARAAGTTVKWLLERAGGYGGDFASTLASLRRANRADVVLSTVDTVGIPLMLQKRAGMLQPPLVYVAVGLPERLARLRSERVRRLYASALASCSSVVAYSEREVESLQEWVECQGGGTAPIEFVPFGVDTESFRPGGGRSSDEVVSAGADPHRDFPLLVHVATRMPETSFRIVTTSEHLRALPGLPANVTVETDLPFDEMRDRVARACVVALPVKENSYSGATTVLLQAMALAKSVVVTRTQAIATGYGLVDGENCRLVAPGDEAAFEGALASLLADEGRARALGDRARATVESTLTWERYVDQIEEILAVAAGGRLDEGSRPV
jgi:glycosyltransferase involved in cell wall biosynthesis